MISVGFGESHGPCERASPASKCGRNAKRSCCKLEICDFPLRDAFFAEGLTVEDGRVSLPTDPGLGVSLSDEALEYAVE